MKKERILQGKKGYRYESEKYGCYDKGMPPHPAWDVPPTWVITSNTGRMVEVQTKRVDYIGSRTTKVQGKSVSRMIFTAQYHPYPYFMYPENLDLMSKDTASAKLSKNDRPSIVLYMSPVQRNSFNMQTCAMASLACQAVCLDYSGQKVGQMKQRAAIARTDMYYAHRQRFWERIYDEIQKFRAGKVKKGFKEIAVRLNGTSDLDLYTEFIFWCKENKRTLQKDIVFYDYTKFEKRVTINKGNVNTEKMLMVDGKWEKNPLGVRHKVTYSLSEDLRKNRDSWKTAAKLLVEGATIAAVFLVDPKGKDKKLKSDYVKIKDKWYHPLPDTLSFELDGKRYTFPIVDGDKSDDLMLDIGASKVIGLRAKQRAAKDESGFAIPVFALPVDKKVEQEMLQDIYLELDVNQDMIRKACGVGAPTPDYKCSDDQKGTTIKTW
jgi:hypothetical protein